MFRERRGPGIDDGPAPAWARGRHQLTMVRSGKLAGDELGEVNQTVGVAPLVVVPGAVSYTHLTLPTIYSV